MQNEIVVLLGQKGMGKTTLAFQLMQGKRYIFLDVRGCFTANEALANGGYLVQVYNEREARENVLNFLNGGTSLVIQASIELNAYIMYLIAALVVARRNLNFWLVVDESNFYMSTHEIDDSIRTFISVGRQSMLHQIYVARDSTELHPFVRSQADEILSFRQREPNQLKYAAQLSDDWEILKDLPKFHYVKLREKIA